MTAFLVVPSMPAPGERLVERLHSPKREIHLMAVVPNHLCQVVHKCIIVLRCQIVLVAIFIPTAQYPHCCYGFWDQGMHAVDTLWGYAEPGLMKVLCWHCYALKTKGCYDMNESVCLGKHCIL